ncbi:alpha/beta fold hydrolase [Mesonia maritima]|uniref:alpha/beta hydrolase n=1 Tax=Mesonia maritima TaxID=1793873 RepID=UPI00362F3EC2
METLQLKKAKLLCHSMGTLIGMEFAKQHPDRVSHLVLAGAILPKSDSIESVFSKRQKEQVNFMLNRKIVNQLSKPYKEKGIDNLKSIEDLENSTLTHKDLTEFWRLKFAAVNIYNLKKYSLVKGGKAYYNPKAAVMTETLNWNYDYRPILNEKMKTTIINGAYDFLDFNSYITKRLLKNYPKIKLITLPEAGHNSWIDQPQLFKKSLKENLE